MPRPRTEKTTRSHHKKPAPAAPELEAMVDTLVDDGTNPDAVKKAAPRRTAPGPKKVLNTTTEMIGDAVAVGVMLGTKNPDARKSLTMPEAQSIGHPIVRMLARRLPGWVKPYLPKTKLNPEDAADVEEIMATLAKWGMRLLTIMVTDFVENKEKAQAERQQRQAMAREAVAPMMRDIDATLATYKQSNPGFEKVVANYAEQSRGEQARQREMAAAQTAPSSNGHNPAFDVLNNVDIGLTEG